MSPRPLPVGKFDGVETLELMHVEPIKPPRPERGKSIPSVDYVKCPGCARSRGVVQQGAHRRICEHIHPTTHVACSRSNAAVHDVWDQAAKQPSEQRCGCYRG